MFGRPCLPDSRLDIVFIPSRAIFVGKDKSGLQTTDLTCHRVVREPDGSRVRPLKQTESRESLPFRARGGQDFTIISAELSRLAKLKFGEV